MQALNLPQYQIKTRQSGTQMEVFDAIRKKYLVLTPEEWVRQQFILYLIHEKEYPPTLISLEKGIKCLACIKDLMLLSLIKAAGRLCLLNLNRPM